MRHTFKIKGLCILLDEHASLVMYELEMSNYANVALSAEVGKI